MALGKGSSKGWVQVELSVPGLVVMSARFWVTDVVHPKASIVHIGCELLKDIYEEADQICLPQWPTPWKELFEWSCLGFWFDDPTSNYIFDQDILVSSMIAESKETLTTGM